MNYDVAIVGYGPTGMTLAALLGQAGRKVVVLERYPGLYNLPRAACFDDETMRTFQKLRVAEKMLPGTNIQRGYEWYNGKGELLLEIEYDNPGPCGWPTQYMIYQPHVEDVLDNLAKSFPNVEVHQGVTVTGLEEDSDGVTITAAEENGDAKTFSARYVVGADGGNGFVRQYLNGQIDDYGFFENWLVCDFEMKRKVEGLPSFRQVCNPAQPVSIVNIGPKHHRFSFRLEADDDREKVLKPENVWRRVKEFISPDDAELIRVANYKFVSCIVDVWRKGRIMLAGDAAHQMPPFLAQGMVSGIRDARNLAWKLDMVLDGCPADLLDTYQPEREPHVRFITEKAIELGRVQTMRDEAEAEKRDERLIAARQANQKPEKLVYPALNGGLIANHGAFLPQGLVSDGTRTGMFDDIVGTPWLIVAKDFGMLSGLSQKDREDWAAISGGEAVFGIDSMVGGRQLWDSNGVYTQWFDQTGAAAAVVRPDSHVYGLAKSAPELAALVDQLMHSLGRR